MTTAADRGERASVDKFAARRRLLAESALAVIAERGYAHTGLRDIAEHSTLSHGSLHYYFDGKDDLVAQAVWQYKSECARRYDDIVATAQSGEELARRFATAMAETLRDEASLHRLWYDLRNQALFDEGFHPTIIRIDALLQEMVWAVVDRYCELQGVEPVIEPRVAYALFDGIFLNALIALLRGDVDSVDRLGDDCARLLVSAVGPASL
ncbi:MAG: TetR/AcrR family transcriptional regulator [Microbacterium sp.]